MLWPFPEIGKGPAARRGGPLFTGSPLPGVAPGVSSAAGARIARARSSITGRSGQRRRSPVRCGSFCPDPSFSLRGCLGMVPRRGRRVPDMTGCLSFSAGHCLRLAARGHRVVDHSMVAIADDIVGFGPTAVLERVVLGLGIGRQRGAAGLRGAGHHQQAHHDQQRRARPDALLPEGQRNHPLPCTVPDGTKPAGPAIGDRSRAVPARGGDRSQE
jgi:hypothetical protein